MKLNKVYVFVEGNDDHRFFQKLIVPILLEHYADVEIIKYAQMKKEKVNLFLLSIQTLDFDYIFTADKDEDYSVGEKKGILRHKFSNLDKKKISIVIMEIESWYLAGLNHQKSLDFDINQYENTENVTKEEFNSLYHRKFRSRIDFMHELMKAFSVETAKAKNRSFEDFSRKWLEYN